MDIENINNNLALGNIDQARMLPHLHRLAQSSYVFDYDFGLKQLPTEPGILLVRGPRQYGKSTWLEQQIFLTIKEFGAGSAFYLNGEFLVDASDLSEKLIQLCASFEKDKGVKRIFIDEITNISRWETTLKALVDNGILRDVLVITTGSKSTDLQRGVERLPGRKGKLARSSYLFTPISYHSFYKKCYKTLKEKTFAASHGEPKAEASSPR
jgi:uncharacterized protein